MSDDQSENACVDEKLMAKRPATNMDASTVNADKTTTNRIEAHCVSIDVSATGQGQHLRWYYSDDLIASQEEEERKPLVGVSQGASHASSATVDADGDSQMDDEENRFRTPQPVGSYDPGSVVLTPHKREIQRHPIPREERIGGGLDWWRQRNGVDERLAFYPDRDSSPEEGHADVDSKELGPDTQHVYNALREERARHGTPAPREDNARSANTLRSQATVIIDPRDPAKPTLFNGEMPIVRQPALSGTTANSAAASGSGSSGQTRRGLSTIKEEGSQGESDDGSGTRELPLELPDFGHVRLFHNNDGAWVRDGSLPPNASYHIDRALLPPKISDAERAADARAARAARVGQLQRTDTVEAIPRRRVKFAYVEIPVHAWHARQMRKSARKAERENPPSPLLRRSSRIRNKAAAAAQA